jgi:hypothetical protein
MRYCLPLAGGLRCRFSEDRHHPRRSGKPAYYSGRDKKKVERSIVLHSYPLWRPVHIAYTDIVSSAFSAETDHRGQHGGSAMSSITTELAAALGAVDRPGGFYTSGITELHMPRLGCRQLCRYLTHQNDVDHSNRVYSSVR